MEIQAEEIRRHLTDCRAGVSGDLRALVELQNRAQARLKALSPLAPHFIDGANIVVAQAELDALRSEYEALLPVARETAAFLGRFLVAN